ncbi:hypothetical protein ANN_16331 [Periplaneta americana]|uniref:Uncharacterized protein n=1 Tax=Periplaneta americana TaxID=6978 RepID=A0ABQ8SJW6_PERAM|nr:hypothetical protein ANN_16331 [Periplaneta americana]
MKKPDNQLPKLCQRLPLGNSMPEGRCRCVFLRDSNARKLGGKGFVTSCFYGDGLLTLRPGHVARMGESRNAYRVLVGRPEGKRPLGRPRRRWEDNIKMDLREVGYDDRDWINLAQDRDRWRAYVRAAMNLRGIEKTKGGKEEMRLRTRMVAPSLNCVVRRNPMRAQEYRVLIAAVVVSLRQFSYKTSASVKYPDVPSVSKPISHNPVTYPIPTAPAEYTVNEETEEESSLSSPTNDPDSDYYQPGEDINLMNNAQLCDSYGT